MLCQEFIAHLLLSHHKRKNPGALCLTSQKRFSRVNLTRRLLSQAKSKKSLARTTGNI
jgi:hypothetical protein